ncbi:MAG: GNAT family N-acetyltransferase [Pseudomonadota bacterium]
MKWTFQSTPPDTPWPDCAMQQHPAYARTCQAWGREAHWAVLGPPRDPVAVAQIVQRSVPLLGQLGLISRGPVWRQPVSDDLHGPAMADLYRSARESGISALAMTPATAETQQPVTRPPGSIRVARRQAVAVIPLDRGEAAHREALHGKWRNRLRRGESAAEDIRVETLPADPQHWLLRIEATQQRTRGYRGLPPAFAAAWSFANPGQTRLFTLRRNGRPIAAMLFFLHSPGVTYQIGWSGPDGRAANAHNLLLWEACRHLRKAGFRSLDLGTIGSGAAPGLVRFKLGAGAETMELGDTWLSLPGSGTVSKLLPRNSGSQNIQSPSGQKA